jgi:hypothetical protein
MEIKDNCTDILNEMQDTARELKETKDKLYKQWMAKMGHAGLALPGTGTLIKMMRAGSKKGEKKAEDLRNREEGLEHEFKSKASELILCQCNKKSECNYKENYEPLTDILANISILNENIVSFKTELEKEEQKRAFGKPEPIREKLKDEERLLTKRSEELEESIQKLLGCECKS